MLRQKSTILTVRAPRQGLHEITAQVTDWTASTGIGEGLLTLFCRHSSASMLIQENAAPAARRDLETYFERIAPESSDYSHGDGGPDDMPAHLRTALTQTSPAFPSKTDAFCSAPGKASICSSIAASRMTGRSRCT